MASSTEAPSAFDAGALLDRLRASGAAAHDPVRFAFLAGLCRRAEAQPAAIRQPLMTKIAAEAAALEASHRSAATKNQGGDRDAEQADVIAPPSPLSELLAHIGELAGTHVWTRNLHPQAPPTRQAAAQPSQARRPQTPELKSVAYFRKTWSKLSTEQQLTQTLAQAPENAGPMNSQHLVLRSLQVMREISPAYLQAFMSYIDTLIWLEEVSPLKAAPSRPQASGTPAKGKPKGRTAIR